jgi:cation transport ATPase
MIPALQFDNWQWLALQLTTPIVLWPPGPFTTPALINLRHLTATMDTLISLGVLAAWTNDGCELPAARLVVGAGARPRAHLPHCMSSGAEMSIFTHSMSRQAQ